MIWFYTGVPGSGKSYHAAKEIYKFIQKGKNIIGNMEINTDNIPTLNKKPKGCYLYVSNKEWLNNSILEMKIDRHGATRLKEPDDIYSYIQGLKGYAYNFHERDKQGKFKLHQTLLILDECQELYNSRSWNRKDRLAWCAFYRLHRKLGYDVILISQDDKCIDKQIRNVLETQVLHRNVGNYKVFGKLLSLLFGGNLFIVLRVNTAILRKTLRQVVNFCSVKRNIIACMIQHNCTRWNLGVFGEITPSTSELVSAHSITHIYTHTYTHARTCAYLIIYTLKRKDFIKGDLNMKKKEINEIMAHVAALSDEKLEEEYYTAVDNCLGSQVDTMINVVMILLILLNEKNMKNIFLNMLTCLAIYAKREI